jgi:hypothetical protein
MLENNTPKERKDRSDEPSSKRQKTDHAGSNRSQNSQSSQKTSTRGRTSKSLAKGKQTSSENKDTSKTECFYCKKPGYWEKDCWKKKKDEEKGSASAARATTAPSPSPAIKAIAAQRPTHPSTRRLVITVRLQTKDGWRDVKALIDTGAEDDFISQMLVKEMGIPYSSPSPGSAKAIDGRPVFIYGGTTVTYKLKDSLGQDRQDTRQMWAVDMSDTDITLGWPWLESIDPIIRFRQKEWRYLVDP